MKAVSLFAGIGGFELAMTRAGITPVASAEIDVKCRAILARHFPSTTHYDDVRKVTLDNLSSRGIGLVSAGWPCQGNSVAGLRAGMADARSGLWWEVHRILSEIRPRWFIGENVPGLLTVNSGRDFRDVIASLDELGYGVAWRVLDAQGFGVPQRRRRVILAGCLGDPAGAAEVLFEPESRSGDFAPSPEAARHTTGASEASAGSRGVGYSRNMSGERRAGIKTLSASDSASAHRVVVGTLQASGYRIGAEDARDGHLIPAYVENGVTYGDWSPADVAGPLMERDYKDGGPRVLLPGTAGVRRLTPLECERLQGFPDGWTEGQSDAARGRQLGNAVAVPVVQWVMKRVAAVEAAGSEIAA